MDSTRIRIPQLTDAASWEQWKRIMKLTLEKEKVWYTTQADLKPAEGELPEITTKNQESDKLAQLIIVSNLDTTNCRLTNTCTSAKLLWEKLLSVYEQSSTQRIDTLMREFFALNKIGSEKVVVYVSRLQNIFAAFNEEIQRLGHHPMPELVLTGRIIEALPVEYFSFKSVWEATPPNDRTVNLLLERLSLVENRLPNLSNEAEPALAVKSEGCFGCGNKGHYQRDCPKNNNQKRNGRRRKPAKGKNVPEDKPGAFYAAYGAHAESSETWFLDSGANIHISKSKNGMTGFNANDKKTITVANQNTLVSKGTGNVNVSLNGNFGRKVNVIKDVSFIPEVSANLLSVGKITEKGFVVILNAKGGKIYDTGCTVKGNLVASVKRCDNGLYSLDCKSNLIDVKPQVAKFCADAVVNNVTVSQELWHRRLGHLNHRSMRRLEKNKVISFVQKEFQPCIACIGAKITKTPFPKQSLTKTTQLLELVHTDVCGPMPIQSHSGAKYLLTIIDDFSRMSFVYFLRQKSEAAGKLMEFKAMAEKQTGCHLKSVRSDNGGEFVNKKLQEYFKENGIRQELTVPYCPQQNGVAERLNRTIVEKARAMMQDASLPKQFWAEAANTACYLRNRSPTSSLEGRIPIEVWTGRKVSLAHLKIFGCLAHKHIEKNKRDKLDPKSKQLIFVGYCENTKGYRLFDTDDPKHVTISRDVIFLENQFHHLEILEEKADQPEYQEMILSRKPENNDVNRQVVIPPVSSISDDDAAQAQIEKRRYPLRNRKRKNFEDYEMNLSDDDDDDQPEEVYFSNCIEPQTLAEVTASDEAEEWKSAMQHEFSSLMSNQTWTLEDLPAGAKAIPCKWVFKRKMTEDGNVDRYRARLVAKGFAQRHGCDYDETYAPVIKWSTLRTLLAIAAQNAMAITHLDVTTAFLYGDLDESVFMKQPEGFVQPGAENKVCRLRKAIYGLKQAARAWHGKISSVLEELKFKRTQTEPCVFRSENNGERLYIALYVDDLYIFSANPVRTAEITSQLEKHFRMRNLGEIRNLLGVRVRRKENSIYLDSESYIDKVLERFKMDQCKGAATPMEFKLNLKKENATIDKPYRELIGCLNYLAVSTRMDIAYAVSYLSQFNDCFADDHWKAAKRVLRYLKKNKALSICFQAKIEKDETLEGYVDADWGGDIVDRKSYSGFLFCLAGCAISWASMKQRTVAQSSAEAEYMAIADAVKEGLFLKSILLELDVSVKIVLNNDSQSAQNLAQNYKCDKRSKHIDIRYHFVRDLIDKKVVTLVFCRSEQMIADFLTKSLASEKFRYCLNNCGLTQPPVMKETVLVIHDL